MGRQEVHDPGMGEKGPKRSRVFVEDARRNGTYLRATWHPEAGQFVLSTWHDDVCTGAVRVSAVEVAGLVGFFADGLADAARSEVEPPIVRQAWRRRIGGYLAELRRMRWLRRMGHRQAQPGGPAKRSPLRRSA